MGTGKEQQIRIETSSGLSDAEIEKMMHDAEAHAEEDAHKKEEVEVRNQADQLVYSTEKSLSEHGDKLSEEDKGAIEGELEKLKELLKGSDTEAIKAGVESLSQAAHKLAEVLYQQAQAEQAAQEPGPGGPEGGPPPPEEEQPQQDQDKKKKDDGAIDADYEVVN
jgi:molecular chaperone DnaK